MAVLRTAELAAIIQQSVTKVNDYLIKSGNPPPSLDVTGPAAYPPLPPDIMRARSEGLAATDEMRVLLMGPTDHVIGSSGDYMDFLGLQFVHRYKIATLFPPGEERTFSEIAAARNLDLSDTTRFLRLAMTYHVFTEPREGVVAHTAVSRVLVDNKFAAAWLGHVLENVWPTLPHILEASERWPGSGEPNETAYVLTHPKGLTPFDHLEDSSSSAQQFSDAMKFFQAIPGLEPDHLLEAFDFSSLGKEALLVDVGGSHGVVSISVARSCANMRCIVQDLPQTISKVVTSLPSDLKGRVFFMEHNFFGEQPIKDADVYYFRWIFHDWSDPYGLKILKALILALKRGARVIISDVCMPDYGEMPLHMQKLPRSMDMVMKAQFNAKERYANEWASLFNNADPRFRFDGIQRPMKSKLSFIIATWDP
ncbi:hypothetical protein ACHAO8_011332 [Botrytis cinerea]